MHLTDLDPIPFRASLHILKRLLSAFAFASVLVRAEQHRLVANGDLRQGGSNFDGRDVMLLAVLLNQALHESELADGQRIRDLLFEVGNAFVVDGFRAWQHHLFDFLSRGSFDRR